MELQKTELTELGLCIRHWENLRWVSMTVFMAIMGGLSAAVLGAGGISSPNSLAPYAKTGGILLVLIFWLQDERIVAYWRAFVLRAHAVEASLGIEVFSVTPKRGLISAGTAVRALYFTFFIAWILMLFQP